MEANVAYYCLRRLHKWPHEFLKLSRYEKAFVIASVEIKLQNDKKAAKEAQKAKIRRR